MPAGGRTNLRQRQRNVRDAHSRLQLGRRHGVDRHAIEPSLTGGIQQEAVHLATGLACQQYLPVVSAHDVGSGLESCDVALLLDLACSRYCFRPVVM